MNGSGYTASHAVWSSPLLPWLIRGGVGIVALLLINAGWTMMGVALGVSLLIHMSMIRIESRMVRLVIRGILAAVAQALIYAPSWAWAVGPTPEQANNLRDAGYALAAGLTIEAGFTGAFVGAETLRAVAPAVRDLLRQGGFLNGLAAISIATVGGAVVVIGITVLALGIAASVAVQNEQLNRQIRERAAQQQPPPPPTPIPNPPIVVVPSPLPPFGGSPGYPDFPDPNPLPYDFWEPWPDFNPDCLGVFQWGTPLCWDQQPRAFHWTDGHLASAFEYWQPHWPNRGILVPTILLPPGHQRQPWLQEQPMLMMEMLAEEPDPTIEFEIFLDDGNLVGIREIERGWDPDFDAKVIALVRDTGGVVPALGNNFAQTPGTAVPAPLTFVLVIVGVITLVALRHHWRIR